MTFSGDFTSHPLAGGEVVNGDRHPDPSSPFTPITSSGPSKPFVLSSTGTFQFYCNIHYALEYMAGSIFLVP